MADAFSIMLKIDLYFPLSGAFDVTSLSLVGGLCMFLCYQPIERVISDQRWTQAYFHCHRDKWEC